MELNRKRHEQLLYKLLEAEHYITINELAKKFEVSARTIRRDLDKLETHLEQGQIELLKKPGAGVWLKLPQREKFRLKQSLGVVNKNELNPETRVRWLIKELAFGTTECTIGELEDKLHISRSTVYNDLDKVEDWLQQYSLSLNKMKNKFLVEGAEKNIRIAIVNLMLELLDQEAKETIIDLVNDDVSINTSDHQILQEFCFDLDLKFIRQLLERIEQKAGILFSNPALLNLCLYLAVSFKRIAEGRTVKLLGKELEKFRDYELFALNELMAVQVEKELGVNLSEAEIGFNTLQMLAAELYSANSLKTKEDIKQQVKSEIFNAVEDLIYYIKYNLQIAEADEYNLFKQLILYIRSLYYAKNYGIEYRDNYYYEEQWRELKSADPYLFRIVESSFDILNDRLNIELQSNEIQVIALFLLAVVEEKKRVIKAVVVFDGPPAVAQLMKVRLTREIPRLEIKEWIYSSQLKNLEQSQIDLIISTREIEGLTDLMIVNPLMRDRDIKRIEAKIEVLSDLDTYFGN